MNFMKVLVLSLIFILSSVAFASDDEDGGARMTFTEKDHDFGDIISGEVAEHVYTFQNTGTDTLRIATVYSSWGCTASLLSSEVVAPADSGEIKVSFNSKYRHGDYKKTITVYSNDTEEPVIRLSLKISVLDAKEE